MSTEPESRVRNALATLVIFGGIFIIIGLIVGFVGRQTGQYGGADCGSVLGGGGSTDLTTTGLAVCNKALSTPTTWTWILLILGFLLLISGWVIDAIQKNGYEQRLRGATPAT